MFHNIRIMNDTVSLVRPNGQNRQKKQSKGVRFY